MAVTLPFFFVQLLWFYMSVAAACLIFPTAFFLAKRRGKRLWGSLFSGFRWTVIGCGALGILLFPAVFVMPGYKPFTLGYWIHVKVWLNPTEVRQWALTQTNIDTNSRKVVPYKDWPASLKSAAFTDGRLFVSSKTKSVELVEGGGFGVWGIIIAQAPVTNDWSRSYVIKLDDAAWVWHDTQ